MQIKKILRLRNWQAGISIIEMMISLVILSSGLLVLSKFQGQLYQSAALSTQRSEAQALAQRVIDGYRATRGSALNTIVGLCPISGSTTCYVTDLSTPSNLLTPSTGTATAISSVSGNSYTTSWKMSSTATSANAATQKFIYRVEVTVSWDNPQGTQQYLAFGLILPSA
ncbi:type IV pilus modification PilV family protein [Andreprevotia chitinilytica]|uniref:type IV pilus modification PilV family protein n=1 Tax=Andreprevotia chitinilytica TaxID=396808 RepID=UPI00055766FD|nr:hypothetical protein [Andreprevotia chitinilytica]